MEKVIHGAVSDFSGAHLACNKNLGLASGYMYAMRQENVSCKKCIKVLKSRLFRCTGKNCPSKGSPQERIIVYSDCHQTLNLQYDTWNDLEVGESKGACCRECGEPISRKILNKFLGGLQ